MISGKKLSGWKFGGIMGSMEEYMSEVNYYFGNGDYKDVLTCMASTKVNSYKTSSLPLAQFWNPNNKKLKGFFEKCKEKGFDLSFGNRFFEYPTPCENNGEELQYSSPSMTDLMIINEEYKVAIEAKYTEYSEGHYETIAEWNKEKAEHKRNIKNQWFKYIRNINATYNDDLLDDTIPYQFLHRTASACYKCDGKTPVLVYQLFYDNENINKKDEFIGNLKEWANRLGFTDKIKFIVIEIEIKEIEKVKEKYDGVRSDLFLIMRKQKEPIYKFNWDGINVIRLK